MHQRLIEAGQQTTGMAQHGAIDVQDQLTLLRQWNERHRILHLAAALQQARHQLQVRDASVLEAHHRLHIRQDALLLQCLLQCLLR